MQRYNTIHVCFRAGIEGVPQKTVKVAGQLQGGRPVLHSSRIGGLFSQDNNTQIVSLVLFVFPQWGIKNPQENSQTLWHPSSSISSMSVCYECSINPEEKKLLLVLLLFWGQSA